MSTHRKQFIPLICFRDTVMFWSPATRVNTPIYDYPHPNIFQSTFNFNEFGSTCQQINVTLFNYSRDVNDLIGQEHFGPYVRNQNFSKYEFWSSIQQLIQTFILRLGQIEKKNKLNFPIHSKNPRLGFFPPFLRAKTFFNKI